MWHIFLGNFLLNKQSPCHQLEERHPWDFMSTQNSWAWHVIKEWWHANTCRGFERIQNLNFTYKLILIHLVFCVCMNICRKILNVPWVQVNLSYVLMTLFVMSAQGVVVFHASFIYTMEVNSGTAPITNWVDLTHSDHSWFRISHMPWKQTH